MTPQNHPNSWVITCAPQITPFLLLSLTKKFRSEWVTAVYFERLCTSWHHYLWRRVRAKGLWDYVKWLRTITQTHESMKPWRNNKVIYFVGCHSNHIFVPRNIKYEKETGSNRAPETSTDYDDIDDDIPIELSKQALQTIQSCKSVKSEIFRQNREIEGRMARSAIGTIMRRHGTISTSTSLESPTVDCDVDDVIVRHKSSDGCDSSLNTSKIAQCSSNYHGKLERMGSHLCTLWRHCLL